MIRNRVGSASARNDFKVTDTFLRAPAAGHWLVEDFFT
jgi:hypothetical protein